MAAPVPEKFEEFCLEVEDCPRCLPWRKSLPGLGFLETARRYRKKYEQILKGDLSGLTTFPDGQTAFSSGCPQCRSPVSTAKARAFFCTEFEAVKKTFPPFSEPSAP